MKRFSALLPLFLLLGACVPSAPADGTAFELADERPRPIPLDSLLRDVRFIRVETSDDALLSDYSLVRRAGDEVWVCDRETEAFLCFGVDGALRERFSRRGRGPQEYLGVRDFKISAAEEIWVVGSPDKLLVYDRSGRLLRQRRLSPDAETLALGGDFCAVQFRRSEKIPYGVQTFDTKRLEPIDSLAEGRPFGFYFVHLATWPSLNRQTDGTIFLTELSTCDMYRVERDTLVPVCRIGLEGHSFRPDIFQEPMEAAVEAINDPDHPEYFGLWSVLRQERGGWLVIPCGRRPARFDPATGRTWPFDEVLLGEGRTSLKVETDQMCLLDDDYVVLPLPAARLAERPELTRRMGIAPVREEDNPVYCIGRLR